MCLRGYDLKVENLARLVKGIGSASALIFLKPGKAGSCMLWENSLQAGFCMGAVSGARLLARLAGLLASSILCMLAGSVFSKSVVVLTASCFFALNARGYDIGIWRTSNRPPFPRGGMGGFNYTANIIHILKFVN